MIQCNRVFSYKELYQFFDVYDDKKLNNDVNKCMNVRLSCLILSLNVGNFLQFYLIPKSTFSCVDWLYLLIWVKLIKICTQNDITVKPTYNEVPGTGNSL